MIYYEENPNGNSKLLELINNDSEVSGCKVSTQMSISFLYTSMNNWNLKLKP
jgi:hypothetical protein